MHTFHYISLKFQLIS
uniref:Uncharacterized protein n=1 Tax=Rhizophora mucronata TaxID=61149 RepID=A0A2P2L131_RHIMU